MLVLKLLVPESYVFRLYCRTEFDVTFIFRHLNYQSELFRTSDSRDHSVIIPSSMSTIIEIKRSRSKRQQIYIPSRTHYGSLHTVDPSPLAMACVIVLWKKRTRASIELG